MRKHKFSSLLALLTVTALYVPSGLIYAQTLDEEDKDAPVWEDSASGFAKFSTAAVSTLNLENLHSYNTQESIKSLVEQLVLGASSSSKVRGNNVIYILDGFVRDDSFISSIDSKDIEEISVLKDAVSRALYGVYGDNTIVLIKTKRGRAGTKEININLKTGLALPMAKPEYMNAADYMTYYNYARLGDNLTPIYSQETIDATRGGADIVGYPDIDMYSSMFLRSMKPFSGADLSFRGGSDVSRYFLSMGWNDENSYVNLGEQIKSNTFNLRGNLDVDVTSFLKASFDAVALFKKGNAPCWNGNDFWGMASSFRPNQIPLLIPTDMINPNDQNLVDAGTLINGRYLLGGSSVYQQNPYGDLFLGGYNNNNTSSIEVNAAFDFDLSSILPGLRFVTRFGYDEISNYTIQVSNTYAVYEPTFDGATYTLNKINNDFFKGTQSVTNTSFSRRFAWSNVLSWIKEAGDHHFDAAAFSFLDTYKVNGNFYTSRNANYGAKLNYAFRQKYLFDAAMSYIGSAKLGYKWAVSPSFGLGWIVSEEPFLKDIDAVSWAKLKASYGTMLSDSSVDSYYYTKDVFSVGGNWNYGDNASSNQSLTVLTIGNPDLFFSQKKEFNAGLELGLFDNALRFEGNYFHTNSDGLLSKRENMTPGYTGGSTFASFSNYGSIITNGFELGISYNKRLSSDFSLNSGLRMLYYKSVYGKVDEQMYENEEDRINLQLSGTPTDAIRGLKADGFYTEEDIALLEATSGSYELPMPTYGTFGVGDIKYLGRNSDTKIDRFDVQELGNSSARYTFMLDFNARWKNLEFYALLRSQLGFYGSYQGNSYWGYISGVEKYPEHLKNAWIYLPEEGIDTRATATYPRLSSITSTHNKQVSSFWLVNKSYISLPELQITYHLPSKVANFAKMSDASIYARATDLFHISKDSDMVKLNTSSELRSRYYTIGLNVKF